MEMLSILVGMPYAFIIVSYCYLVQILVILHGLWVGALCY